MNDIVVFQAAQNLEFGQKAPLDLGLIHTRNGEDLERNFAADHSVSGPVDKAHAAAADEHLDFVTPELLASFQFGHERLVCGRFEKCTADFAAHSHEPLDFITQFPIGAARLCQKFRVLLRDKVQHGFKDLVSSFLLLGSHLVRRSRSLSYRSIFTTCQRFFTVSG